MPLRSSKQISLLVGVRSFFRVFTCLEDSWGIRSIPWRNPTTHWKKNVLATAPWQFYIFWNNFCSISWVDNQYVQGRTAKICTYYLHYHYHILMNHNRDRHRFSVTHHEILKMSFFNSLFTHYFHNFKLISHYSWQKCHIPAKNWEYYNAHVLLLVTSFVFIIIFEFSFNS